MPITPFLIIGAISWILVGQIAEAKRPTYQPPRPNPICHSNAKILCPPGM
jgi:hypothetical protein